MDDTVTSAHIRVLRDILDLTDVERHAPGAGVTRQVLERVASLLGCDRVTFRAVEASGERGHVTVGTHDTSSTRPAFEGPPSAATVSDSHLGEERTELVDCLRLGWPLDTGRTMRIELVRESGMPFGRRELILLDLLRPHLTGWLAATMQHREREGRHSLTARQVEILRLVQVGMSNREIARNLRITEATVRKHLENAFDRLGVLSRTAAVSAAFSPVTTSDPEGHPHERHLRHLA
jgi:DNA-binding CsgD family transcriptional regulator